MKVGFLHTSQAHVDTFESIVRDLSDVIEVANEVVPELLHQASTQGLTVAVSDGVNNALKRLADQGCAAITCTCSTLGQLAERQSCVDIPVLRIDRAAADSLFKFEKVLVVVALESAAEAADQLLEESASHFETGTRWKTVLVPGAWPQFELGDITGFHQAVSDFSNQFGNEFDAVFLAQASMSGAQGLCTHANVITSPRLGVQQLLACLT